MDDAISRQAVLKLLSAMPPEEAMTKTLLIQSVKQMDVAQPETHDKRTETHGVCLDIISRQEAIDALGERPMVWIGSDYELGARNQYDADVLALETVPSAEPSSSCSHEKDVQPGPEEPFEKCSDCIHAHDSEDICVLRRCKHAIAETVECFEPKQPERKRGKWIAVTEDGDVYKRICSCCGREAFFQNDDPDELYDGGRYELSDFCPHCGADMREVEE